MLLLKVDSWKLPILTGLFIIVGTLLLQVGLDRTATSNIIFFQGVTTGVYRGAPQVDWEAIPKLPELSSLGRDKWVVVTSINAPTLAIETLVNLTNWQVLVVGDTKSPQNWSLPGAIFLSVEAQAALGYRILKHIPYKSYARKNIGYLYAIQHGAKVIYETDDDNILTTPSIEAGFDIGEQTEAAAGEAQKEQTLSFPVSDNGGDFLEYAAVEGREVVNPYIHFGQPSVWPRGYPLDAVADNVPEKFFNVVPRGRQLIQQGLANGDPDVDAIFRLTRRQRGHLIRIQFDGEAPAVGLPEGLMAPFNSQNTLFHADALWALLIPVTTAFRVCDIWRGYWAQRLLWEVAGTLAFFPPSVRQDRNVHDYFADFVDESALYRDSGRLVRFLLSWHSSQPHLFDRVLELSYGMARERFWAFGDAELTLDWLQDLITLGYEPPKIRRRSPVPQEGPRRVFEPRVLPSSLLGPGPGLTPPLGPSPTHQPRQAGTTPLPALQAFFGDVVVIVNYNWAHFQSVVFWRMVYGRFAKSVVVMAQNSSTRLGVMGVPGALEGWLTYRALPDVYRRFPDAAGFLLVNDDLVLNYWNLLACDKTKFWHIINCTSCTPPWNIYRHDRNESSHSQFWQHTQHKSLQEAAVLAIRAERRAQYRKSVPQGFGVHAISDTYYVPQRFVGPMSELIPIFATHAVRSEMAIPAMMLAVASPADFDAPALSQTVYLWHSSRRRSPSTFYNTSIHALHPWKPHSQEDIADILKALAQGDENLWLIANSMAR